MTEIEGLVRYGKPDSNSAVVCLLSARVARMLLAVLEPH